MSEEKTASKAPTKTPVYKKWWFWVIIVVALICISMAGASSNSDNERLSQNEEINYSYEVGTEKRNIEEAGFRRIKENYEDTEIDRVVINDDVGTDNDGDYIVLTYVKWNRQNKEETTKDMLRMYCDDFAASLGNEFSKINEVVMFWDVSYHSDKGTSKCAYERREGGMALSDKAGLIGDK